MAKPQMELSAEKPAPPHDGAPLQVSSVCRLRKTPPQLSTLEGLSCRPGYGVGGVEGEGRALLPSLLIPPFERV